MSGFVSRLYIGHVHHRRHRPRHNAFRYRTYQVLLDVDELPRLDRELPGFGYNRPAPVGFRDRDHWGEADLPVRDKLARWLGARGVQLPVGPVLVLTNLRVLGHVFDPVSWWFCHGRDGSLAVVVAEVHNTFGETHGYLLDRLEARPDGTLRASADKAFHVSPFLPVAGLRYDFIFRPPDDRVLAHLAVRDRQGTVLDATQAGHARPLTGRSLTATLLTHPLLTLRTVALIHWQALRLWTKRVPFHRKPAPPVDPVLRPPLHQEVRP